MYVKNYFAYAHFFCGYIFYSKGITRNYRKEGFLMADCNRNCSAGAANDYPCDTNFREAVCIHTDKIYDSCRDKDCVR